jgi:anti-sigma factor ChrR (cupin superfamily)
MNINDDFSRRVVVHESGSAWIPSPMQGVERKMLDRIGGELARATSIVRYAPGSRFAPHVHGGGEEFLVLEGTFQDERGDYPAGSYVRNPPQSRHTPGSVEGCTIFVKLWQFDPGDRTEVVRDVAGAAFETAGDHAGVTAAVLFRDDRETVRIERWAPGARVVGHAAGGIEILCLDGGFVEAGEKFIAWSWLRLPVGSRLDVVAGDSGCRLWVKEGHLRFAEADRERIMVTGRDREARP